jgi:hypothetical protein
MFSTHSSQQCYAPNGSVLVGPIGTERYPIKQFQARHGLADMVVVADAGMLSAGNLRELDEANLRFIVGSRMTKAPNDLASHFRWHGDAFTDGQLIDTITPRTGNRNENNPDVRTEPAWGPAGHPGSWRAVWAYSRKRAVHDRTTLTAQENRAREVIEGHQRLGSGVHADAIMDRIVHNTIWVDTGNHNMRQHATMKQ